MSENPATRVSLSRRLAASAVDGALTLALPAIWWHWSEWAIYTDTFGRRWPRGPAMAAMALIPFTVVWLEAVTGRGAGKGLCGLRVRGRDGRRATARRRAARSAVKWSPVWVGVVAHVACVFARSSAAEDFAAEWLLPGTVDLAERLSGPAAKAVWTLGVSLRSLSYGAALLPVLALGQLGLLLPSRRTLVDRLTGTRVSDRAPAANRPLPSGPA